VEPSRKLRLNTDCRQSRPLSNSRSRPSASSPSAGDAGPAAKRPHNARRLAPPWWRRHWLPLTGLLAVAGIVAATALNVHFFDFGTATPATGNASAGAAGTEVQFRYLSAQRSNSCDLTPETVRSYPDSTHLQGSCCNAMDMGTYQTQVDRLRAYREVDAIPSDPYDVPVSLAKRLLAYDGSIQLNPGQQATYDSAMAMTDDKAPCCCKCWRWYAFRGLAKYLIAQKQFGAPEVARVIDLVDGCGGKHEVPGTT